MCDAGKQVAFTNAVGVVKYGSRISTRVRLHTQDTHTHTQACKHGARRHQRVCLSVCTAPVHL